MSLSNLLPDPLPSCREKEGLARCHARAMEAAKQAAADERTAWRAAVTEKLKRQAADREERLRGELLKQRDEQLEVSSHCGGMPHSAHCVRLA